ncbi:hypothetical protein Q7P35_007394 [Cladosporium inversicolor]
MSSNRQTRHEHAHGFDKPMLGFFTPKSVNNESALRKHFVAASGEFVGTFLFLFTAYLGHSMSVTFAPDSAPGGGNANQTVVFIALSYGFSLLIAAWVLYRISGGLFNPAVTLGMVITGTLPPMRGLVLFPAQILGAMSAAGVVSCIIPADIAIVQTTLAPNVNVAQGLFLEMFLTAHLIFTILMLAAEKSKDTFIAPIGIGLSLFVVEIAGVNYSGASVNPARSFGPCVAAADFPGYFWIYFVGPVLGALLAAGFYHFVKFFNYEDANPGQDSAGADEEFNIKPAESDLENGSPRN